MCSFGVETAASMFTVSLVNKAPHLIAVVNETLRSVLQNAYRLIALVSIAWSLTYAVVRT